MIELTVQQAEAVRQAGMMPTTFLDPHTKREYILVRSDEYSRIRGVPDEGDACLMAPLLADLDPEDWQDASAYESQS